MMEIQITEKIDPGHWHHLTQWRERVFPEEGIGKEWTEVSWHLLAFADDQNPVAHVGFDVFDILIDGVKQKIIGVGGVVVRPEYQGQGIPAILFESLHEQGFEITGVDIYALFCPSRLGAYYSRHGYLRHNGEVWFVQNGVTVLSQFEFMHRGGIAQSAYIELLSPPW